jgi:Rrf2 family protein
MIKIAQHSDAGKPVNLTEIAETTSVSKRYLEQLVIPLKNASLVRGVSGKEGGYLLARSADEIRVGDIIEASIGPINLVDCVDDPDFCMKTEWCECRPLYVLLNRRIRDAFNSFTLSDLAEHKIEEIVARELGKDDELSSTSSEI